MRIFLLRNVLHSTEAISLRTASEPASPGQEWVALLRRGLHTGQELRMAGNTPKSWCANNIPPLQPSISERLLEFQSTP